MNIAYAMAPGKGDIDLLLNRLADKLAVEGFTCCGTVQINTDRAAGPCDMDVKVLPDGPTLQISQNLGAGSKGCRLDSAALEEAVGLVAQQLTARPDLLIVNKFGKHEADGRGFRPLIAQALMYDIPVLVGVNALNLSAFNEFAANEAHRLEPSKADLLAWCRRTILQMRSAA